MADISFSAFVEKWNKDTEQHPDWGMRTAEAHRKNENGEWVTVSRTYRTVRGGWDKVLEKPITIDFTKFPVGSRVMVVGVEKTVAREYEGKTYYDLVVDATSVTPIAKDGQTAAPAPAAQPAAWTDDTPF